MLACIPACNCKKEREKSASGIDEFDTNLGGFNDALLLFLF